jgi:hypothetical protein
MLDILKHKICNKKSNICYKPWRLVKGAAMILTNMAKIIQRTENS